MKKNTISAIVLYKDEKETIMKCLNSLQWVDDIVLVVDSTGPEKIDSVSKIQNLSTLYRNLNDDFAQQRNFGLMHAKGNWVLFVDADEVVSVELGKEIRQIVSNSEKSYAGYQIRRIDAFMGKKLRYGETKNAFFVRLAQNGAGTWSGKVHETWIINESIGRLNHPLYHFAHPTIRHFLASVNHYSDIRARELVEKRVKSNKIQMILFPLGKFLYTYIILLGFLDGMPGLCMSLMMSFHSFLVRSKVWEYQNKTNPSLT